MAPASGNRDQASWWHGLAPPEKEINICGIERNGGGEEDSGYMEVRLHCGVVHALWVKMGQNANWRAEQGCAKDPASWNMDEVFSDDGSLAPPGGPHARSVLIGTSFASMTQIKLGALAT